VKQKLLVLVTLIFGLAFGTTFGLGFSRWRESKLPPERTSHAELNVPRPEARSGTDTDAVNVRLRRLEQAVRDLEQGPVASQAPGTSPAVADEDRQPLSVEEATAQETQRWLRLENTFASEAPDRAWAGPTETNFRADFTHNSQGQFQFKSVECRTTTCSAKVVWPNFSAAMTRGSDLVSAGFKVNCERTTTLPPPRVGDEDKPYVQTLMFLCADQRADSAK
jgi:hypothetical protein